MTINGSLCLLYTDLRTSRPSLHWFAINTFCNLGKGTVQEHGNMKLGFSCDYFFWNSSTVDSRSLHKGLSFFIENKWGNCLSEGTILKYKRAIHVINKKTSNKDSQFYVK